MASRKSLFNRNGLVTDQSLTDIVYSQISLDRVAKTATWATSRNSVDSILTHVNP